MMGGTIVFVRKTLGICGIVKQRTDYGELVSFQVLSCMRFHVVYRNPKSNLSEITSVFTDLLNIDIPCMFVGDFNF